MRHENDLASNLAAILRDLAAPATVAMLPGDGSFRYLMVQPDPGTHPNRLCALADPIRRELGAEQLTVIYEKGEPLLELQIRLSTSALT